MLARAYGIWQVTDGKEITDETCKEWIARVNSEYGLTDKNALSWEYISRIKDGCLFLIAPFGYAVLYVGVDMWGDRELDIISYYIAPQVNRSVEFRRLQRAFERIADDLNCRWIVQGSHLNPKIFKALGSMGYEPFEMRKEIKRWE